MQTATKQLWASAVAAIVGSLCCVAPLVLITLGISGAWIGHLTALEPYRPIFIGVMLVFLGLAFRQLYIVPARCAPGEVCANPRLQRRQRQIFWIVVAGLAVLIAFPWYAPLLLS
jgi:mercuric ion transport protein